MSYQVTQTPGAGQDGDGDNEIIATLQKFGNTSNDKEGWLAIFKHSPLDGRYVLSHTEFLGADAVAAGVDTADFNGNGKDELALPGSCGATHRQ